MHRAITASSRAMLEEFREEISPAMMPPIAIASGMRKNAGFLAI